MKYKWNWSVQGCAQWNDEKRKREGANKNGNEWTECIESDTKGVHRNGMSEHTCYRLQNQ